MFFHYSAHIKQINVHMYFFLLVMYVFDKLSEKRYYEKTWKDHKFEIQPSKSRCMVAFLLILFLAVEVVSVLSCHSSCQGQVFSCTPFAVSKQCEFEEFCSLHDFVMACQTVLRDVLMAVHISSCFTLKLDCSHVVSVQLSVMIYMDVHLLKKKLNCMRLRGTVQTFLLQICLFPTAFLFPRFLLFPRP